MAGKKYIYHRIAGARVDDLFVESHIWYSENQFEVVRRPDTSRVGIFRHAIAGQERRSILIMQIGPCEPAPLNDVRDFALRG